MTKRIPVFVYPDESNNIVQMKTVERRKAASHLSSLEKSLARMRPKHTRGTATFTIEDKPGQTIEDIALVIDAELFSVIATKRITETFVPVKHPRIAEIDKLCEPLTKSLRAYRLEARKIEKASVR